MFKVDESGLADLALMARLFWHHRRDLTSLGVVLPHGGGWAGAERSRRPALACWNLLRITHHRAAILIRRFGVRACRWRARVWRVVPCCGGRARHFLISSSRPGRLGFTCWRRCRHVSSGRLFAGRLRLGLDFPIGVRAGGRPRSIRGDGGDGALAT